MERRTDQRRNLFRQRAHANIWKGHPILTTGGAESHLSTPRRAPRPHPSSLTATALTGTPSPLLLLLRNLALALLVALLFLPHLFTVPTQHM